MAKANVSAVESSVLHVALIVARVSSVGVRTLNSKSQRHQSVTEGACEFSSIQQIGHRKFERETKHIREQLCLAPGRS